MTTSPDGEVELNLSEGTPVISAAGEVLGTVGEIADQRFKVRAPLAPDYWLDRADILGIGEGGDLMMRFEIADLEASMRGAPAD